MTPEFKAAVGGMASIPQWFAWRLVLDTATGKYDKTPWAAGRAVDAGSPANWMSYDAACAMVTGLGSHANDGAKYVLGFRLTEGCGYFLYDLDKCVTGDVPNELTQLQINAFPGAMLEFSSSRQGIHIIGKCSPIIHRSMFKELNWEFYTQDRGIAFGLDGRAWGSADTMHDAAVVPMVERYFKPRPINDGAPRAPEWHGPEDDVELLRRIYNARTSANVAFGGVASARDLMEGAPEQTSENDARLAATLAWWTGRDVDRIERIMRASKLVRPKWDEYRPQGGSYLRMTIENSCAEVSGCYVERSEDVIDSSVASKNTELANAYRLQTQHGGNLLHVAGVGWHVWGENGPWRHDKDAAHRLAFGLGRTIQQEADDMDAWVYEATVDGLGLEEQKRREDIRKNRTAWAKASESKKVVENSMSMAEHILSTAADTLDVQPLLVGCPNGVLDLATGAMREHRREDRITKTIACDYDPAARAPLWDAFVHRVMGGDAELIAYLKTLCGYMLCGERGEHALPVFFGSGANGKSTFLATIQTLMGDYAGTASPGLLLARKDSDQLGAIAALRGRRLVVVSESGETERLDESRVKQITGGDRIAGRPIYKEFIEFTPTHMAVLQTNSRPRVTGTDDGIWRRLKLVPFAVTIPAAERDPELPAKLRAEFPGILAWMVEGWRLYQQHGFVEPQAVKLATATYRSDSDSVGRFIAERCSVDPTFTATTLAVYSAYQSWCAENGERSMSQTALGLKLAERPGIEKTRTGSARGWRGLRIDVHAFSGLSGGPTLTLVK